MRKEITNSLAKKLLAIAGNAKPPTERGKRLTKVISVAGKAFALTDEVADEFHDLTKDILKIDKWSEKFSEKYVSKNLQQVVLTLISDKQPEKAVEQVLEDFISKLETYAKEWTVIIPLFGLELHLSEFEIGKVMLFHASLSKLNEKFSRIEKSILGLKNTDLQKRLAINQQSDYFVKALLNRVCAEFTVSAEPIRARELAEQETRRIIDCFMFAAPALYSEQHKVNVGLWGR